MPDRHLIWRALHWSRPLDPVRVADCLRQWAADERSPFVVLETRLTPGGAQYLVGFASSQTEAVLTALKAVGNATLRTYEQDRVPVMTAGRIRATTRHRALRLNDPEASVRALLAPTIRLKTDELLVVQIVLGPRRVPLAVPAHSPSSTVQPWWSVAWMGDGGQIDSEKRAALRAKVSDHGFAATIRLGVSAAAPERRKALLLGLLAGVRVAEAPGLQLRLVRESTHRLNSVVRPWRWPLRLGVPELVGLSAWPLGDADLPGQPAAHPKLLPPPPGTTGKERVIADVAVPGSDEALALPIKAAVHHLHVIGPTGVGKSTLLANLIDQDIAAGYGVVVIEPKGDLVADVLARVPDNRHDDVVVLNPNDGQPVGINPLTASGRRPELVADSMLSVLRALYGKNIGPRSADILYAGLLTLAHRDDASLVMLPLLLTNPGIRRSLTAGIRDPLVLEPFWATFDHWTDAERAAAVAPVMNKLRPLLRQGLRGVLGQRQPRFHVGQVFNENKVLLVPLQRGVLGRESAGLLGSLVVAEVWQAIQARAALPASKRRPVMVYIDEVQDYLHLPTDLGEALAQARGYGVGFTLSHQYLAQLPAEMREAVLANARSRVSFQVAHGDARVFERGHAELTAADFEALGKFQIYASIYANGTTSPYAIGRTRPLASKLSDPRKLAAASRARYGRPLDDVEAGFASLIDDQTDDLGAVGRRRRQS